MKHASEPETSVWRPEHVAGIARQQQPAMPEIIAEDARPLLSGKVLWDYWPLQLRDGRTASIAGGSLWMFLSAPRVPDPDMRHDVARIRLIFSDSAGWRDCGDLLPPDINPGSREWSGSAIVDPADGRVDLFFTACGRRGERQRTFEQRIFSCTGTLRAHGADISVGDWSAAIEAVANDGSVYFRGRQLSRPRLVRGFRDPFWFRDPADERGYLLFTGSVAHMRSPYSALIGLAGARTEDPQQGFTSLPPILSGAGLVSEMERPHIIVHAGLYYLFWSTSDRVFSKRWGRGAPSGLYGMVAPTLRGPYTPLNGTGLVLTNPRGEPHQTYCWQVLPELQVTSFIDRWGMQGCIAANDPDLLRSRFGGTPAPVVRLELQGASSAIAPAAAR